MSNFQLGKYGEKMYELWSSRAGKSTEVELRMKMSTLFWTKLKQRLSFSEIACVVTNDEVSSKNNYRCISSKEGRQYQKKIKVAPIDFSLVTDVETGGSVDLRFAVAEEMEVTFEEYSKSSGRISVRARERYSFKFPKFTLDLTKVTYANVEPVEHQIELEWTIDFPTSSVFYETLYAGLKILFPTLHTFYEKNEFEPYLSLVSHRGKAPVNIKEEHIETGMTGYYLTNKLDGVAYSLFILQGFVVLKNSTDCWSIPCLSYVEMKGVEIRCEIVEGEGCTEIFLFDLISYSPHDLSLFSRRLELLQILEKELVRILGKEVGVVVKTKKFRRSGQIALDLQETKKEIEMDKKNDGIIFQPEDAYVRSPLKWKFVEKISIDLLLQKASNSNSYRLFYKDIEDQLVAFKHPVTQKLVMHTPKNIGGGDCTNLIAEMGGRMVDNKLMFFFMKFRMDKTSPNFKSVVEDTCYDMLHKRTFADLVQQIKSASPLHYEQGIRKLFTAFPETKVVMTYSAPATLLTLLSNTFKSTCTVFAAGVEIDDIQKNLQKIRKRLRGKVVVIKDTVNVSPHPLVVVGKTIMYFTSENVHVYPKGMLEILNLPFAPTLSLEVYEKNMTTRGGSYELDMKKLSTALFYEQQDERVLEMICCALEINLNIWNISTSSCDTLIDLRASNPTLYLCRSSKGFELF